MPYCNKCGVQMEEGAQFCSSCGQAVAQQAVAQQAATQTPETAVPQQTVGAYQQEPGTIPQQHANPYQQFPAAQPMPYYNNTAVVPAKKKRTGLKIALGLIIVFVAIFVGSIVFSIVSDSPPGSELEYTAGSWEGETFRSNSAKLRFDLPEGWAIAGPDEIKQILTADPKTSWDMVAYHSASGENVIIGFEDLTMSLGGTKLDVPAYAELVKAQMKTSMGSETEFDTKTDETFLGENYVSIRFEQSSGAVTLQKVMLMRRIGDHMMSIIITAADAQSLQQLEQKFSPLA